MNKLQSHTKLTAQERDRLALFKAQGLSGRECARRLNRGPSTVCRELTRNGFQEEGRKYYSAIYAESLARAREQKSAHAKNSLKNTALYELITARLRDGWSPSQISGRLRLEHPTDKRFWICHETIYRWIYQKEQQTQGWYEYLRRKQTKRRKKSGRRVHRTAIPDRVSIRQRSEIINQRSQFGHWEGDTIEGLGHKDGIHTEVERISRLIMARKVKAITSREAIKAQREIFNLLPALARQSTTLDNGRENHLHFELRTLGMQTFFADPYSSWQRGTNENGNWHLRYYLPKGTDLKTLTEEELQDIVEEINNRPRKILGFQTAKEVYQKYLA